MKWTTARAIRYLHAEAKPDDSTRIYVHFPLSGLRACSAFDFLKNHSGYTVIAKH